MKKQDQNRKPSPVAKERFTPILGSVVILLLLIVHIMGMIWAAEVPETLNNILLLVVGYFFGQARE